jgi:hypothetical protein
MNTTSYSKWYSDQHLIITCLTGLLSLDEIIVWEKSLYMALSEIPHQNTFKILVNLHGFTAENFDAHKRFRTIIPAVLADYGWKVGYVNLFEESAAITLTNHNGIQCVAAAHVHHDKSKIDKYSELFNSENEQFYTSPARAKTWIESIKMNQ